MSRNRFYGFPGSSRVGPSDSSHTGGGRPAIQIRTAIQANTTTSGRVGFGGRKKSRLAFLGPGGQLAGVQVTFRTPGDIFFPPNPLILAVVSVAPWN